MSLQPANEVTAAERAMAEWMGEVTQADEIIGHTLIGGRENEETLDNLIGVPFLIEKVTFRRGDISIAPKGQPAVYRDYVSVEALIRPDYAKKFKRSRVVFNDGSTGIYRQIVKYLEVKEVVTLPDDRPEEGPANTTKYDVSFTERNPESEGGYNTASTKIRLFCPEGVRKSPYTNEYGEAETWYLA